MDDYWKADVAFLTSDASEKAQGWARPAPPKLNVNQDSVGKSCLREVNRRKRGKEPTELRFSSLC